MRAKTVTVGILLLASACVPAVYGPDPMSPLPWVSAGSTDIAGTKVYGTKTCTAAPTATGTTTTCTQPWTQTVTRYYWQQFWRYRFHHHNEYTNGTHSDCWVMYDANVYYDFGDPGNVGTAFGMATNTWGTPISKSPDGHAGMEAGHGCGHTGTLEYHREWVQIQRVVGLHHQTTFTKTGVDTTTTTTATTTATTPTTSTTATTVPVLNPT